MNLKTTIRTRLNDALNGCSNCAGTNILEEVINEMLLRLNEPLRVAIIGVMKAGKSTLLNAIMKERILITGTLETTYTVSWFKYAPNPGLKVVFKNGSAMDARFEDLEKWTVRDVKQNNPLIDDVKYVEIYYPSEVLKDMELIDTPGLWSSYEKDSNNTLDFMALNKTADEATKEEASAADAIIYAFNRGMQQNDAEILKAFQGEGIAANTSPINALGVYTKSDIHWECRNDQDPFEAAKDIADNYMENPSVKTLLYTISTISAMMVESIWELDETEWSILYRLSKLDEPILLALLSDISFFVEWDANQFENVLKDFFKFDDETKLYICTVEERDLICSRCGRYGIYEITRAIRANMTKEQIIEHLYEKSGIKGVGELICQHFGNRAFIIKLQYIFSKLLGVCSQIICSSDDPILVEVCKNLKEEIHNIQDTEQVFKELKVLQNYYNGLLKLRNDEEEEQLLQITGEYGGNCEAKLGASCGKSIAELSDIAANRIRYWNSRANDIPITSYYEEAATVLARSCDIMHYHLQSLLGDN